MRRVKCRWCHSMTPSANAIRIKHGSQILFYCCEEHYQLAQKETEEKERKTAEYNRIYDLVVEICDGISLPFPVLKKEVDVWLSMSDFQRLESYLTSNKHILARSMSKEFNSAYCMVRYLSAIVKDKIAFYKLPPEEIVHDDKTIHYEIRHNTQNLRTGFSDMEDAI